MSFGTLNPEKIWHERLTHCPPHLSYVAIVPWEIQKSHFQQYYLYILLILRYLLTIMGYTNPRTHSLQPTCPLHLKMSPH